MLGPFKCPDCGIWWAGFEHRCLPLENFPSTKPTPTKWAGHCCICSGNCMHTGSTYCPRHQPPYTYIWDESDPKIQVTYTDG